MKILKIIAAASGAGVIFFVGMVIGVGIMGNPSNTTIQPVANIPISTSDPLPTTVVQIINTPTNIPISQPTIQTSIDAMVITATPKPTIKPTSKPTLVPTIKPTAKPVSTKTPTSAPVQQTQNITSSGGWSCNCSRTCPNMSCEEAQYQLNVCGCGARDGDNDGIACDAACQ